MVVGYVCGAKSLTDVLDRVLDKGIVVDAWRRVRPLGIDLGMAMEARMVMVSIDTYLKHTKFEVVSHLGSSSQAFIGSALIRPPKTQRPRVKRRAR